MLSLPPSLDNIPHSNWPPVLQELITAAAEIYHGEAKHKGTGGCAHTEILVPQMVNFAYNMVPFSGHYDIGNGPLPWWENMLGPENTSHIVVSPSR